jgi:hypothetical protein
MPPHHGDSCAFADPQRDARDADVFWRPSICSAVLPAIALPRIHRSLATSIPLKGLDCRVAVLSETNRYHHILFSQAGRALQLELRGAIEPSAASIAIVAVPRLERLSAQIHALRSLADLARNRCLRPALYPPAARGARFVHVLQALDGWHAGATQREIAMALFGEHRVDEDWSDPRQSLRDQTRRAIARAKALMTGGYLQLIE